MHLNCLDCLREVEARLEEKRRAQRLVCQEKALWNGNDMQQAQYFEGEIAALEFVTKLMHKALNRETHHETSAGPAPLPRTPGLPQGAGEANGLGR